MEGQSRKEKKWTKTQAVLLFYSYTNDAPELYHRKLGDLAFLVQNYELAYSCYHTAKRDFNGEHAWFYFAGSLVSYLRNNTFDMGMRFVYL